MGGDHHAPYKGLDAKLPYGGFHPPPVKRVHKNVALFIGTTMWFWVFWRLKHDWRHLFTSHRPYEITHEGEDEHH